MANQTNVVVSKLGSLNTRDFLRGLLMAVITAVLQIIYAAVNSDTGIRGINWDNVINVGLTATIGYILMNLGTGSQIIVNNVPKENLNQVKEGASIQVAGQTIAQKDV